MKKKQKCKYTSIGGQALIEGIMMRSEKKTAFTVRKPDGETVTEYIESSSIKDKYKFLRAPVLRGVVGFIESMMMGYKTLMRSADYSLVEEEPESVSENEPESAESGEAVDLKSADSSGAVNTPEAADLPEAVNTPESTASHEAANSPETAEASPSEEKQSPLMSVMMIIAMVIGLGLAVVLFMWLPTLLFDLVSKYLLTGISKLQAVFESVIKIFIFIIYLASVTLMKDIKRVFSYHGAEHKTIFCYEKKLSLTVENVRLQKRFHPRCGTSFLVLMMAVSIIINSSILLIFPGAAAIRPLWVAIKILMIPLICGVGYEALRLCGKYDNLFTKIISAPGMWIQRLTTKEPDDSMIEVAITALKAVLPEGDPLGGSIKISTPSGDIEIPAEAEATAAEIS